MTEALTSTKRLAKNTIMMYIRMGITMIAGLITTRVVLKALGADDFGLYNAVSGIVVLITFLNNSLMLATQRYLSYAIGEGNKQKLQDVFNASSYIYIAVIGIILLLGETIGLWFLNTKMVFPDNKIALANFVYQFSLLITCFNVLRTPFNSLFVATEKMDFYALLAVVEALIHLGFVYLLVVLPFNPSHSYIVLQTISVVLIVFWIYFYFKKHFSSDIRITKVSDKKLFKELLSFSGWGIFGSAAVIGFQQGINILLNMFFGVTVNAAFGIANKVNSLVNQFFTGFLTAANPQITKAHAAGDVAVQTSLINRTTKISFFLLLLVGTVVIYNLDFLLKIWLEDVPDYTISLSRLMIIGAMVDALSSPLYVTIYATGKIKWYQITISVILLMNIVITYALFKLGNPVDVCMYVRIFLFIVAYIARLLFVKSYTKIDIANILKSSIFPIIFISAIVMGITYALWPIENHIIRLFLISPIMIVSLLAMMFYIGFDKVERGAVLEVLSNYNRKIFKK